MYQITKHTFNQAKRFGLDVKPSRRSGKKLDVFRKGEYVASIGAEGMGDYGTYLETEGKAFAKERRRLYHKRHPKGPKDSPRQLSKTLLW